MKGELQPHEAHPAAHDAMEYIKSIPVLDLMTWVEAFSSCAIEGNRLGEVCAATLERIMKGEPVSDRYLLGLAWAIQGKAGAPLLQEMAATSDKMESILTRTANALKGEPPANTWWSWHDLPEVAAALRARASGIEVIDEGNPEGTVEAGCFAALCDHI